MARISKISIHVLILALIAVLSGSCQAEIPLKKINGISLVASRDSLSSDHILPMLEISANAVALVPYAFVPNKDEPGLIFNTERQWFGERVAGIEHAIKLLKKQDLRLMIKPHIWLRNGEFTGDFKASTERDWVKFESTYRDYILLYARVAEENNIETFCIGTELFNFADQRPDYWKQLIADVRSIYKGKLVYAENWDKVDKIEFWDKLDYIGVDAYFPLSEDSSPTEEEIRNGWQEHKTMLEDLSQEFNKPVMFTEYGYRSIAYALKEPWNSSRDISGINPELQARALKVLYEEFWGENWFAGGYIWKWHQSENAGGPDNDRFTPQNKPAEAVIQENYENFRN